MLFFGASPSIPRYIFGFQIDFWMPSKDLTSLVYIALPRLRVSAPLRALIPLFCSIWDLFMKEGLRATGGRKSHLLNYQAGDDHQETEGL